MRPEFSHRNPTLARHLAAEAVHDADAAASTYVDDSYYENGALGLRFEGRDMVAFQYATSFQLIHDMHAEYDWEVDLGDVVVQCGRITGTADGDMLGVPMNGGALDFPFTAVITLRDGLMEGEHIWYDLDLFCEQAGADVAAVRAAAAALNVPVA
jgi:hypothetical protein